MTGDVYCGRLRIALQDAATKRFVDASVDVPPPRPWGLAHLEALYEGASALDLLASSLPNTGTQPWRRVTRIRSYEALVDELLRLRAAAIRWIRSSCSEESSFFMRLDRDRAGGRERGRETLCEIGRTIRANSIGTTLFPEKTIRQFATADVRFSSSTAALLTRVMSSVRALNADPEVLGEVEPWVVDPVAMAAALLRPPSPLREPAVSSWPVALRDLRAAALRALTIFQQVAPIGESWVPLSALWRLYEMWLAHAIAQRLTALLGTPDAEGRGNVLVWRWVTSGSTVRLHYQAKVRRLEVTAPRRTGDAGLRSVTAELIPDLLLTSSSSRGDRHLVIDAKRWLRRVTPEDAATEGSKYLWGARCLDYDEAPALKGVILVSPVRQVIQFSPLALIEFTVASPPTHEEGLADEVDAECLRSWLDSVGVHV